MRDFAARVASGDYGDPEEDWDDGWQGRYGWDDEGAVPAWVADADAPRQTGTEAALEIWSLDDTDVPEALARYLRCVYEATSAQTRAMALGDAWSRLPWSPEPLTLTHVAGTPER